MVVDEAGQVAARPAMEPVELCRLGYLRGNSFEQNNPIGVPRLVIAAESPSVQVGGYRASSRLTAIAERDDHGVWRAGSDATTIAESEGFRRVLRIGPQMRDQMVMCSAQAF